MFRSSGRLRGLVFEDEDGVRMGWGEVSLESCRDEGGGRCTGDLMGSAGLLLRWKAFDGAVASGALGGEVDTCDPKRSLGMQNTEMADKSTRPVDALEKN